MVNRFQNALTPATLIAGFTFESMVHLDFLDGHQLSDSQLHATPVFYIAACTALCLALYVTAVSSMGIVFGQRLVIQATAAQGSHHDETVRELNTKFYVVLLALGGAMVCVVVGAHRRHAHPRPAPPHVSPSPCPLGSHCSRRSDPCAPRTPGWQRRWR